MHFVWLCPICLALAAWFIAVERTERYLEADVIKGVASFVFVVLGWIGSWYVSRSADPAYVRLVIAGLALGGIADVVLNLRYVFEGPKGKAAFLAGILVFLVGHVAYIFAVARRCSMLPLFIGAGVVLTPLIMWWIFKHIEAPFVFKAFGVVYIGAITIMNCVALGAAIYTPGAHSYMFLAGALLFFVSDIVLILNTFGPESRFTLRVTNLMLYYVAQLLIALSLQLL